MGRPSRLPDCPSIPFETSGERPVDLERRSWPLRYNKTTNSLIKPPTLGKTLFRARRKQKFVMYVFIPLAWLLLAFSITESPSLRSPCKGWNRVAGSFRINYFRRTSLRDAVSENFNYNHVKWKGKKRLHQQVRKLVFSGFHFLACGNRWVGDACSDIPTNKQWRNPYRGIFCFYLARVLHSSWCTCTASSCNSARSRTIV